MNEVSVKVAQLLFCVCLSAAIHVGRQPPRHWEDRPIRFLNTFGAQGTDFVLFFIQTIIIVKLKHHIIYLFPISLLF